MQRSDFSHFVVQPIRWGDMDALSHVNNVQYFRYLESGRIAYMEDLLPGEHNSAHLILADIQCSFLRQLRYPGTVEVGTRVSRIGRSSLQITCAIFLQGEELPAATGQAVIVWFDFAAQRSAPVPARLREAILARERIVPATAN
jgi:acyl-CoA thioester hydrolase